MRLLMTFAASFIGATVVVFAPAAAAQPSDSPCTVAVNFFCQFIPVAPDWEGTVDLTTQQPPADPNAPLPESLPPLNPCINGCI